MEKKSTEVGSYSVSKEIPLHSVYHADVETSPAPIAGETGDTVPSILCVRERREKGTDKRRFEESLTGLDAYPDEPCNGPFVAAKGDQPVLGCVDHGFPQRFHRHGRVERRSKLSKLCAWNVYETRKLYAIANAVEMPGIAV
ncbi:uncharacterized protein N7459_008228 [Penicillium hispanicum]|uniref:uncharacterized protein n=1 Tax=Penicillium hispanicum TaxID=1080232 RepID=UPI00254243B0|nr:uncharacterized protein N7459_008228 [Penicillium hispanicum]KAJ5573801.1 hypothetical protein N7459_008228 [Penicillium hispanicum]